MPETPQGAVLVGWGHDQGSVPTPGPFRGLCAPALWLPCPSVPRTTLLGGPPSAEEAALAHRARAPGVIPAGQPFSED